MRPRNERLEGRRVGLPGSRNATPGHKSSTQVGRIYHSQPWLVSSRRKGLQAGHKACRCKAGEEGCRRATATIELTSSLVFHSISGSKSTFMAQIFPFRALRYDGSKVPVSEVVTQPYDKISPAMQERYYKASPYNLVRIILGRAEPGNDPEQSVYTRAASSLRNWQDEGVLVQDAEPSIYLYTQTFTVPGDNSGKQHERRGFIAAGQLEEYERKIVFRHEQTLSKPKADRLNLLRATHAHFGQIFMLYSDPSGEVDSMLTTARPPHVEVTDEYAVTHRLWKISGPSMI